MSKLDLQVWHPADSLKKGWAAVTSLLSIHEDTGMEHHIHAKLGNLLIERDDFWIVGIPVRWNHLDAAQTKFVVTAPHFFDHQVNRLFERTTCQLRNRI